MSSAATSPPPILSGGQPAESFHRFPDLPAELRIRIWQMAYNAIPDPLVYRFRLEFSFIPDPESDEESPDQVPEAYLIPSDEMKDLTRELRNLQRVSSECRHEGDILFDDHLRLNQTEHGVTTHLSPPINLPWKSGTTFFSFVGLYFEHLDCLRTRASTTFIDQVFSSVRLLGICVDREFVDTLTEFDDLSDFAELVLKFSEINHVALVCDRLMSESDLEGFSNNFRSSFMLCCWDDWVGKTQEDVFVPKCRQSQPDGLTMEDHMEALEAFADEMLHYGETNGERAMMLWNVVYGMIFRTKENFGYLLMDDDTLDELLGEDWLGELFSDEFGDEFSDEFSDGFSDDMPGLELIESGEA